MPIRFRNAYSFKPNDNTSTGRDVPGGVQFMFDNGYTISIGASRSHYCSVEPNTEDDEGIETFYNCEIAIWDSFGNKEWLTKRFYYEFFERKLHDDVVGGVDTDELAYVMYELSKLPDSDGKIKFEEEQSK